VLLHNRKELDNDLGARSNKHLALTLALGVDNAVKSVVLSSQPTINVNTSSSFLLLYAGRVGDDLRERKCEPWWAIYVICWAGTGISKDGDRLGWLAKPVLRQPFVTNDVPTESNGRGHRGCQESDLGRYRSMSRVRKCRRSIWSSWS